MFQESKTAWMARSICSRGSCGKSRPASVLTIFLNLVTSFLRSAASSSVSTLTFLAAFAASSASSKRSPSTPRTVLPNIWMRRRYESQAKRSSPACLARPFTDLSESPMFRTVSIIPGIENFAPERTETSRGSSA